MAKFSLETHMIVYDDEHGEKIVVRPDSDGLGQIEVQDWDHQGKLLHRVALRTEQVPLLIKALEIVYQGVLAQELQDKKQ